MGMNEILTTTYKEVEITYDEYADVWRFDVRGRERRADTLKRAKEVIDKPEPKEKKPFEKFDAIINDFGSFRKVIVTSIAEQDGRSPMVWVSKNGSRSKEQLARIYVISPENLESVKRHKELDQEITDKREEQIKLLDNMEHPVIEL